MHGDRDERLWASKQFSGASLGDKRRVRRLVRLGRAMAENPGASLPELCSTPYDVKATYNLFKRPEATPDNLQAGHRRRVRRSIQESGHTVLLPEDTSELRWETTREIPGLGPIGNDTDCRYAKGFLLHTVLAVRWTSEPVVDGPYRRPALEVLGLADQLYEVRKLIPEGEAGDDWQARHKRERESEMWSRCTERLGPAPGDVRWVRICDRGADIYEFLTGCSAQGHGYVVRAAQDRSLVEPASRLFATARSLTGWATFTMQVRERPKRPAHTAKLTLAACRVKIRSPQRPGASPGKLPPVSCSVVRVWEVDPPHGSEPLEWILLSDLPVESLEQALEVALQYSTRWVIEDFHKALKTGLGAERLYLEDAHRLFAAISVMSVDALRLLELREALRVNPDAPAAASGLDALELKILRLKTKRTLRTVHDVALALGRLGGHMNRKADGMPGLITLWRGQKKLRALVEGARLGSQLSGFG
jgi:hypothetical protein